MALFGLKGVEDKTYIKCVDVDGKYLGKLPSKYFNNEELTAIGVGSTYENMNAELMKVFLNKEYFNNFSDKLKITSQLVK